MSAREERRRSRRNSDDNDAYVDETDFRERRLNETAPASVPEKRDRGRNKQKDPVDQLIARSFKVACCHFASLPQPRLLSQSIGIFWGSQLICLANRGYPKGSCKDECVSSLAAHLLNPLYKYNRTE